MCFGYDGEVEVTIFPDRLGIAHVTSWSGSRTDVAVTRKGFWSRWAKLASLDSW